MFSAWALDLGGDNMPGANIALELLRRSEQINTKLADVAEAVARIAATCEARELGCGRTQHEYSMRIRSLEAGEKRLIRQVARLSAYAAIAATIGSGLVSWLLPKL